MCVAGAASLRERSDDGTAVPAAREALGRGAVVGDGALTGGMTWEALNNISDDNDRNLVIIVNDNEEDSYIAAFDKTTGKLKWKTKRKEPTNFSTPFIWKNSLRNEIITTGVEKTRSYDLEGKPLWSFEGMSTICIPTPFAAGDRLYLAAGYVGDKERPNKPVYVIKPGGSGDISLKNGTSSTQNN